MNESAKVANVFNSYLESVTEPLDLFNRAKASTSWPSTCFSYRPSIIQIRQNKISKKFSLASITFETVKNVTNGLPQNKSVSGDIPLNVLT